VSLSTFVRVSTELTPTNLREILQFANKYTKDEGFGRLITFPCFASSQRLPSSKSKLTFRCRQKNRPLLIPQHNQCDLRKLPIVSAKDDALSRPPFAIGFRPDQEANLIRNRSSQGIPRQRIVSEELRKRSAWSTTAGA
jgi:hypothetical protein